MWARLGSPHPAAVGASVGGERGVEREDGLHADVQAGDVERLEHDLRGRLPVDVYKHIQSEP